MIRLLSAADFWAAYKPFIIAFAVMAVLAFILLQLLIYLRRQTEAELERLRNTDADLFLERLENNKRLKFVFRKPIMCLYRLDGYLLKGDDARVRGLIRDMDGMRLEPRDKVEFLQRRMSFFVSVGEAEEARQSYDRLCAYLHSVKADEVERYRALIDEGAEIIRIYLDRDTGYMPELRKKAERTENPVRRGIMYYRLAKLAHFKGDAALRESCLRKAGETLSGTYYEAIIQEALTAPEILETK